MSPFKKTISFDFIQKIVLAIILTLAFSTCAVAVENKSITQKSFVFGGAEHDYGSGIAVVDEHHLIVAGNSSSGDFENIANTERIGSNGKSDIFIALISRKEHAITKLLIIGGDDDDFLKNICLDQDGNLYLTGSTFSQNFPSKQKYGDLSKKDKTNVFLIKTSALLEGPTLSITFGGEGFDYPGAIAVASDGIYVGGNTSSANFPVTVGSHRIKFNSTKYGKVSYGQDVFLTKFDLTLSYISASTFLGGDADEFVNDIKISDNSEVIVAGTTHSQNFPRSEETYVLEIRPGGVKTFIATLPSDLSKIGKSMVLETTNQLYVKAMAIAPDKSIWITGYLSKGIFPFHLNTFPYTENTIGEAYGGGGYDSFLIHFKEDLTDIISASYLGGNNNEFAQAIAVSPQGNIIVGGFTDSFGTFPVTFNYNDRLNFGHYDTFITEFSSDLTKIYKSTLSGGSGYDYIYRIVLNDNALFALGNTTSKNIEATYINKTGNKKNKNAVYFQSFEN